MLSIMNYIALIIPHSYSMDAPITSEMMKLPDDIRLIRPPPFLVDESIFLADSAFKMGGMLLKTFPLSLLNLLMSSFFNEFLLLNTDGSRRIT
jgi:hypothetical protein